MHAIVLALLMPVAVVHSFIHHKPPPDCAGYRQDLVSLFNFMCDTIADDDVLIRDSCTGCFQRSTTIDDNDQSLDELSNCATLYLPDTRYESCINRIGGSSNYRNDQCLAGYCRFVRCVRRSNSDLLIAQCYGEASADNDAIEEDEQVNLVKNVTSCILARARCSSINPISGKRQTNRFNVTVKKWGKTRLNSVKLYNSMQITPEGDLRIIGFPETTKIQDYACFTPNLRQSSWMEYNC